MSRRAAAALSTGKKNVAFSKKRDSANLAAIRAVARSRPINSAGAQVIARHVVRNWAAKNIEDKYYVIAGLTDGTVNPRVSSTPTILDLSNIPLQTSPSTDQTRVGDKVTAMNFEFRGSIFGGSADTHMRVVFFQWKDVSTSSIPNSGLVIHQTTGDAQINGIYNRDMLSAGTLRILGDYRFPVSGNSENENTSRCLFYKTKKMAKQIQYNAGTTTEAKNKIFMWYACTITEGSSDAAKPTLVWTSVLDYQDA